MAEMERDTVAPQIAPKDATVTMVVFSDYQCPYCHKLHPELRRLLADDHKIHFIYRDWPIFGDASIDAARLAIASQYQGRHEAFDDALSATTGKLDAAKIRAAAVKAGVNWARLQSDLVTHRQAIDQLLMRHWLPRHARHRCRRLCDVRRSGSHDVENGSGEGTSSRLMGAITG
jgi:hypothetical protein